MSLWTPMLCATLLLGMTGCAGLFDPYERAGTLRPAMAARSNLAAMAANPPDLISGAAPDGPGDAHLAAAAVARLRADQAKPLPDSGIAALQSTEFGNAPAAAPPAPAAAGQ